MKLFTQKSADLGSFPSLFLSLMPLIIPPLLTLNPSADASGFPYTLQGGLRSAIRVGRVMKEVVDQNESDVRWFVFGDEDTVLFVDKVVRTLSKYDHDRWFYVGSNSESYDQNLMYSFEMAFGGGGFAISHSLAGVLSRVLDSCLRRYGHLYGSDSRIYSCITELGIALTHEPGFHPQQPKAGASGDFQEFGSDGKSVTKRKFSIDAALEDKICDLYDLFVDGLDENAGPQIRKLYAKLKLAQYQLWFVDDNDSLLDLYSRSPITALAKDKAYARISLDEISIH